MWVMSYQEYHNEYNFRLYIQILCFADLCDLTSINHNDIERIPIIIDAFVFVNLKVVHFP